MSWKNEKNGYVRVSDPVLIDNVNVSNSCMYVSKFKYPSSFGRQDCEKEGTFYDFDKGVQEKWWFTL